MKNTDENIQTGENLSWVSFEGRIGRKAFRQRWLPIALATFYISYLLSTRQGEPGTNYLYLVVIPLSICGFTFKIRRLRDIGSSKWRMVGIVLLSLLPIFDVVVAGYLLFKKGRHEEQA